MHEVITIGAILSQLGKLGAAISPRGLGRLTFGGEPRGLCEVWAARWAPQARVCVGGQNLDALASELEAYFAGRLRAWTFPLDLRGTPFQLRVWQAVREVP